MPDPVTWVIDHVATSAGGALFGVLVGWVMDALISVTSNLVRSFADAADPNVTAEWFVHGTDGRLGPYAMSAKIAAVLLVGFVLAGITQGVLTADVTGMVKRVAVHLPAAVLGTVALGGVTHLGVQVVDALSEWVLAAFDADLQELAGALASVARSATSTGGTGSGGFVVVLVGVLAVVGGLIVVLELVVRSSLVYLVVALGPLAFAAALWPALGGVARKLLELLGALVASKLVIALALAVAAAALTGAEASGTAGGVSPYDVPPPDAGDAGGGGGGADADSTNDPGTAAEPGSAAPTPEVVGVLLAGAAAFGVAAFSPLLVVGLFGLTAGATAGQGVRQMPTRGAQQGARALGSVARLAAAPTGGAGMAAARKRPNPAPQTSPTSAGSTRVAVAPAVSGRAVEIQAPGGGNGLGRPRSRGSGRGGAPGTDGSPRAGSPETGSGTRRLGGAPRPGPDPGGES